LDAVYPKNLETFARCFTRILFKDQPGHVTQQNRGTVEIAQASQSGLRLARSTSELLRIAERLTEKNAGLQSLNEPWADTTSPSGRMVMTIFAGIAEFERTLIISRTSDGRVAAKARGVIFGRPKKLRLDQQELARELVRDGKSISAVARTFNVHPATIHRVIAG